MEVNYYAKAKDWILRGWIDICKKVHKDKRSGVTFIDLYAGDGKCTCPLPTGEIEEWPGSALRAAIAGCSGEAEISVVVNEKDKKVYQSLENNLKKYDNCVKGIFNGDARDIIDDVLEILNPKGHNFFFIDPFGHSDVDMKFITKIAKFGEKREKYKDEWYTRRPEILFNFPSSGMARCIGSQAEKSIDQFFGHSHWRNLVRTRKDLIGDLFSYSLMKQVQIDMGKYYTPTGDAASQFPFEVVNQQNKSNMYWLLMFATHPLARTIYRDFVKYAESFFEDDVIGKWVGIRAMAKARDRGIKTLDKF